MRPVFISHGSSESGENKMEDAPDTSIYKVVVNHEEQYSIWRADLAVPPGWTEVGKEGSKQECLTYIRDVWVDMRPLSLRKAMLEQADPKK
jgi:MbtH protein